MYVYMCVSWLTVVKADAKALYSIATTLEYKGECFSFP